MIVSIAHLNTGMTKKSMRKGRVFRFDFVLTNQFCVNRSKDDYASLRFFVYLLKNCLSVWKLQVEHSSKRGKLTKPSVQGRNALESHNMQSNS